MKTETAERWSLFCCQISVAMAKAGYILAVSPQAEAWGYVTKLLTRSGNLAEAWGYVTKLLTGSGKLA